MMRLTGEGDMHYGTITGGCLRGISALAVASFAAHAALLSPVAGLAAEPQPTLQSLQQQLDQRDALIQDLMRRLDALERPGGQSASTVPRQDQEEGKDGVQRAAQAPAPPGAET